jgi:hypothetical protein
MGTRTHLDSPHPWLGSMPPPYSLYTSLQLATEGASKWHKFPGLPKWSLDFVPAGLPELWTAITPYCRVGSRQGLNRRDLSKAVSHSRIGCREGIDSRLLVVESQTASLTPGPSFAHNLGCRCPNGQCEDIFDIYVLRPFQWHQEHPNARCFAPCCRALNIWESRRTPNPQLFQVLGFTPHLAKLGLRQRESTLGVFGVSPIDFSTLCWRVIHFIELHHILDRCWLHFNLKGNISLAFILGVASPCSWSNNQVSFITKSIIAHIFVYIANLKFMPSLLSL